MSSILPLTVACIMNAAAIQGIQPHVIVTILNIEGGKVGECVTNTNGTQDCGPMQVNTGAWLDELARLHFGGDRPKAYATLRDNGCYNVHVGTWILRRMIERADGNVIEGIGLYHSATPSRKRRYQTVFSDRFRLLFGETRR
jgi:hypothetical protein